MTVPSNNTKMSSFPVMVRSESALLILKKDTTKIPLRKDIGQILNFKLLKYVENEKYRHKIVSMTNSVRS